MISGQSSRRLPRALTAAVPLCAALLLCGCGESLRYSPDLHYPARTDPIVDDAPKEQPWASEQPGRLDEEIAAIPKKGGKITDPKAIDAGVRAKLTAALNTTFGTPYAPQVGAAVGEDETVVTQLVQLKVRDANLDTPFHALATGSKAYRFHCVHCHGLTGDGRGPTGPWVVPHPRDYRPACLNSSPVIPRPPESRAATTCFAHCTTGSTALPCRRSPCSPTTS